MESMRGHLYDGDQSTIHLSGLRLSWKTGMYVCSYIASYVCTRFFLTKKIGGHKSFFLALFWTSSDVCFGFQSQGESVTWVFYHLRAMNSTDSPLVQHLLAS